MLSSGRRERRVNGFEQQDEGLDYRRRYRGLIGVHSKVPIRDRSILSLVYTPGVAEACLAISQDPLASFDLTCRGNTVAILTDGSDLFGREGGPPEAAIPVPISPAAGGVLGLLLAALGARASSRRAV